MKVILATPSAEINEWSKEFPDERYLGSRDDGSDEVVLEVEWAHLFYGQLTVSTMESYPALLHNRSTDLWLVTDEAAMYLPELAGKAGLFCSDISMG